MMLDNEGEDKDNDSDADQAENKDECGQQDEGG